MNNPIYQIFNTQKTNIQNVKLITDAANKGIELMNREIDYALLNAYQNYIISILNIVSNNTKTNYIDLYNRFCISNCYLSCYDQLKRNIEFLIDLAKRL